jgi:hypothetical protein
MSANVRLCILDIEAQASFARRGSSAPSYSQQTEIRECIGRLCNDMSGMTQMNGHRHALSAPTDGRLRVVLKRPKVSSSAGTSTKEGDRFLRAKQSTFQSLVALMKNRFATEEYENVATARSTKPPIPMTVADLQS